MAYATLIAPAPGASAPVLPPLSPPMLVALLRYALVLETGRGGAPEEVFLQDRALQLVGLSWLVIFGLGVYLGHGVRA